MLKVVFYTEGALYWSSCSNGQNYVPQLLVHSTLWFVLLEIGWCKVKKTVSSQILCACKKRIFKKKSSGHLFHLFLVHLKILFMLM